MAAGRCRGPWKEGLPGSSQVVLFAMIFAYMISRMVD